MSLDDLSRRARIAPERLQEWDDLGLLGGSGGGFGDDAPERARLVQLAVGRGLAARDIETASRQQGDLIGRFAHLIATVGGETSETFTVEEAAERVGLDPELARRVWAAGARTEGEADDDDVEAMRAVRTALDAGMPAAAILQLTRVYADALGRVADAESRLFQLYVHGALRSAGADAREIAEAAAAASNTLIGLTEPAVVHFHRRAFRRALREDVVVYLSEEVAPSGPPGHVPVAVLFVDLASFTPMTEAMGDEAAADVVDRFSELVRAEAAHWSGRVVKQIGDEFMLVFRDAVGAVSYALRLGEAAAAEDRFPSLRMGAHTGSAVYREADYLGATVNVAARVAAHARGEQLVVTRAILDAAPELPVTWTALGDRELKGLRDPIELFFVPTTRRVVVRTDPVCGMSLSGERRPVHVSWRDLEVYFCSEGFRQRFELDPIAYESKLPHRRSSP